MPEDILTINVGQMTIIFKIIYFQIKNFASLHICV